MKKNKNSFISPVKKSNIDNNNRDNVNNSNVNNKTTKKKSSSFQTPVKVVALSPANNNKSENNTTPIINNSNSTQSINIAAVKTTITTTNSNSKSNINSTPLGLMETNVKSINSEVFTTIPKYILEFLNQFNDSTEKEQNSLVIDYCYLNWSNNPFNEYDLFSYNKDKLLNLEKIKDIILNLVNNNILKEINVKDNIKIYSSIPWFKLINYVGLEIEIKRYEEKQLELEKEKVKEKENKKQSKYNTVAPKNTIASIVATLSPSKPKENHLASSSTSSSKKRKSLTSKSSGAPIPFNLNQELDNDNNSESGSSNKKLKVKTNSIKSSKYELSIDRELILISDEKKRLLKSIKEKRETLLKFQSKSSSPISEQKKVVPNQEEEKRVEGLIYKWKKASQDAITLLQEKVIEYMGKQDQQQQSSVYKFDDRSINGYKSSNQWADGIDTDENDKQYQQEHNFDYFEKEIVSPNEKDKQPDITSKLYIINQFGLNAKDLNYDEENDQFKKL